MKAIFIVLLLFAHSQFSLAGECTMRPMPIDVKRIAGNSSVKAYTVADSGLVLNALLKDGSAIRIIHEGCAHSGAEGAMWLNSATPLTDVRKWLEEVLKLSKIAFAPSVSSEIENLIRNGSYSRDEVSGTRLKISAAPAEYIHYTFVVSRAEQGYVLVISYIEG